MFCLVDSGVCLCVCMCACVSLFVCGVSVFWCGV